MPVAALPIGISPVELSAPLNGAAVASSPLLEWVTTDDDVWPGAPVHFNVQVASSPDFSSPSIHRDDFSSHDPSPFAYEDSPGVWVDLPASGLPYAELGKKVRYAPEASITQPYYWRVRIEQYF